MKFSPTYLHVVSTHVKAQKVAGTLGAPQVSLSSQKHLPQGVTLF